MLYGPLVIQNISDDEGVSDLSVCSLRCSLPTKTSIYPDSAEVGPLSPLVLTGLL